MLRFPFFQRAHRVAFKLHRLFLDAKVNRFEFGDALQVFLS